MGEPVQPLFGGEPAYAGGYAAPAPAAPGYGYQDPPSYDSQVPGNPQRTPQQSGSASGANAPNPFNMLQNNPMAAAGLSAGSNFLNNNVKAHLTGVTAFWGSLRYYFDVNNQYVKNKLKAVLMPFRHSSFQREVEDEDRHSFKPPALDVNAPDLYIPVMAFITFVLVTGLLKGTRMSFTPEVLGDVVTASLVTQTLEVLLLKGALFTVGASALPFMDLVCYTGYKYVGLIINTTVGILMGGLPYYIALLATGAAMAFFMLKTLLAAIPITSPSAQAKRRYLCMGAAALQVVLMWWLGYSGDL